MAEPPAETKHEVFIAVSDAISILEETSFEIPRLRTFAYR